MTSLRRVIPLRGPLDLRLTLGLHRRGAGDPTFRFEGAEARRATRTPSGACALQLRVEGERLEAEAWGPGAAEALERTPALVGEHDEPSSFTPRHPIVRDLARRLSGLRVGRTDAVVEALVPAILEQKVTGREAWAAWKRMCRMWGEPAPGPLELRLPPDPAVLAEVPYFELHRAGVERRRADLIRFVCARARRIEETGAMAPADAARRLLSLRGVGQWTVAEVAGRAWGDPDAVSLGDYHLPHLVSWALAGEPRGDDDRMLELLEPYAGQRGRVIRLLESGATRPPRRGPRMTVRSIRTI